MATNVWVREIGAGWALGGRDLPGELAWTRADGTAPSSIELRVAAMRGALASGLRIRTWPTEMAARGAAAACDLEVVFED